MTPCQRRQSGKYHKTQNISRYIFLLEKRNSADLGQDKRNRYPLSICKWWSIFSAFEGMKMTSRTLFYADISVKLYKHTMRKIADVGICRSSESVVLLELQNVYPPQKRFTRFSGLLAIKRQITRNKIPLLHG